MIIHQLVVFYWRGSWELMDLYIFPDNKTYSAIVSFGIAYGLMILLCGIQPLFNFLFCRYASTKNARRRFLCSWLLEAVTYFFSNFVNVGLWRGTWLICDVYVLPDQPDLAHGIILAAGLLGLWVMMCGHSIAIRGCDIDGDTNGDDDAVCICPNLYIRGFRKRKNESTLNLVTDSKSLERHIKVPELVLNSDTGTSNTVVRWNSTSSILHI